MSVAKLVFICSGDKGSPIRPVDRLVSPDAKSLTVPSISLAGARD